MDKSFLPKAIVLVFLNIISSTFTAQSQIDNEFWFVIPEITVQHNPIDGEPTAFRITSARDSVYGDSIIVDMPATGLVLHKGLVAPRSTASIDISHLISENYTIPWQSGDDYSNILESGQYDTEAIVSNRGIRIRSFSAHSLDANNDISVSLDRYNVNNKDIWSLKGQNALGTSFTIPSQNIWDNKTYSIESAALSGFDIVATEDHTEITITATSDFRLAGGPGDFYKAGNTYSFYLNKGETFAVVATDHQSTNHFGGTIVTASEDIAITLKDDSLRPTGMGYDVVGDQLIPDRLAGEEYLIVRGDLGEDPNTTNKSREYAFVIALEDNTEIEYTNCIYDMFTGPEDKNSWPSNSTRTLNKGEVGRFLMNAANYNNGVSGTDLTKENYDALYFKMNKPVHVFHITGFRTEVGGAVVPTIDHCTGSKDVSIVCSSNENFYLNIITDTQHTDSIDLWINGVYQHIPASHFSQIPSTDWCYLSKPYNDFTSSGNSGDVYQVKIKSTGRFHLSTIEGDMRGCKYAYFSNFSSDYGQVYLEDDSGTGFNTYCYGEPIKLQAKGGVSYKWSYASGGMQDSHKFLTDSNSCNVLAEITASLASLHTYQVTIGRDCDYRGMASDTTIGVDVLIYNKMELNFDTIPIGSCQSPKQLKIENNAQQYVSYWWTIENEHGTDEFNTPYIDDTISFSNSSDIPASYNITLSAHQDYTCYADTTVSIRVMPELKATADLVNNDCRDANGGSIGLNVRGGSAPYTFLWSNNSTTLDQQDLYAGEYSVTISDANNCQLIKDFIITQPDEGIAINETISNVLCYGDASGAIDLNPTNGTSPYAFLWGNNSTEQNQSNLSAGSYSVTITDDMSCERIESFSINEPSQTLAIIDALTNVNCKGDSTGSISLKVTGGTSPYTYGWSNDSVSNEQQNLSAGTYAVTVSDANNCELVKELLITEPDSIVYVASSLTNVNCFGDSTGSIALHIQGGIRPYDYLWNNGSTSNIIEVLPASTYQVSISDANNCLTQKEFLLHQPKEALSASEEITDVKCANDSSGSIEMIVSGGIKPYKFYWSNELKTSRIDQLKTGEYSVTISDSNNCKLTKSHLVKEPVKPLIASGLTTMPNCNEPASGSIGLNTIGGTEPYTYLWKHGATEKELADLIAGDYRVTVSDFNNCTFIWDTSLFQQEKGIIQGVVQSSSVNLNENDATVILYNASIANYEAIAETDIQKNGYFEFTDLTEGDYTLHIKIDSKVYEKYPNLTDTYLGDTYDWTLASSIKAICGDTAFTTITIKEALPNNYKGEGTIMGTVYVKLESSNELIPIELINVLLIDNKTMLPAITARTDANGQYSFKEVANGSYSLHIDHIGLTHNSTYNFKVQEDSKEFRNMDFIVDKGGLQQIDTLNNTINTNIEYKPHSNIKVYPNPVYGHITITLNNKPTNDIEIMLLSNLGSIVKKFRIEPSQLENGKISIDLSDIIQGNYLLQIKSESINITKNIVKMN